ncbi:Sialic acid-binding Ig-like lectin 5, partial [Lemmus lemmus]
GQLLSFLIPRLSGGRCLSPVTSKPVILTSRTCLKLIKPPFSGHLEEPRIFHCAMLWLLLLCLLWAGSLAVTGKYELSVTTSVTVQEGLCIYVSCQVHFPTSSGSVFGYWFYNKANIDHDSPVATNDPNRSVQKETEGRFHLMGDPDTHNCSLEIRDAKRSDSREYFFRVDGSVKYSFVDQRLNVSVIALTETPNFQLMPTLVSGTSIQLICSLPWACERGTPPIFSWMSSALTSLGPRTTLSSELKLTPRPQDHGSNITCQVTFPGVGVTVEKTEQLSVTCECQAKKPGFRPFLLTDKPEPSTGVVQGAVGGAGLVAFLAVCLCLVFFM